MTIQELLQDKQFANKPIIETDRKGRITYFKSENKEYRKQYDNYGRLIYDREPTKEIRYQYNIKGGKYYQYTNGYEQWFKYDSKGRTIKTWDNNGVINKYKYNTKGMPTYSFAQLPDGSITETFAVYNKRGDMVDKRISDGSRETREYDRQGKLLKYENSDGEFQTEELDRKNRVLTITTEKGIDSITKYDRKNKVIEKIQGAYHYIREGETILEIYEDTGEYVLNGVVLKTQEQIDEMKSLFVNQE